jgi:hypothetical protein
MSDASANGKHQYVHQDDGVIVRVDTVDDADDDVFDDDVLISVTFDGHDHPHSAEMFSMEQVEFLHDRFGRILDDDE